MRIDLEKPISEECDHWDVILDEMLRRFKNEFAESKLGKRKFNTTLAK